MHIICDSRQHAGKHAAKDAWFSTNGVVTLNSKIPFGDYCLPPKVAVDTKMSMGEIATNIGTADHKRFRAECIKARDFGCHLYVLVENDEGITDLEQVAFWDNPRLNISPNAITGQRLYKAMHTMQDYYGVTFLFCRPEDSARIICEILERGT